MSSLGIVLGIVVGVITSVVITCFICQKMAYHRLRRRVKEGKAFVIVVTEERRFSGKVKRLAVVARKPH